MMKALFNRFVREEKGQDLIEYALLAGFISLAAVGAITAVGTELTKM
jgi:Flp pilus assembly pilin Flp